jgi:hypothetical protein
VSGHLSPAIASIVAYNVILLGLWEQARLTWFMVGIVDGSFAMTVAWLINSRTYNLTMGSWAERWTSSTLRKQRGWTVIDSVPMDAYDLDHVAITPRAVLVVETKYYGPGDDTWPPRRLAANVRQAARNCSRADVFFRHQLGLTLPVVPVLMLWGVGTPSTHTVVKTDDVWVVSGNQPQEFLSLWDDETLIAPRTAIALAKGLEQWVARRDHYEATRGRAPTGRISAPPSASPRC